MKIGVRAHDFSCDGTIDVLIAALKEKNVPNIQLALYKALDYSLDTFSSDDAVSVHKKLCAADIDIDVLGCYINPIHPDDATRKTEATRFMNHIEFAKTLDARLVGTETGSVNADFSYSPENHSEESYHKLLRTLEPFVKKAEETEVDLGIEAVYNLVLCSPKKTLRMIDDLKSNRVNIILDPINLLNADNHANHLDVVKEALFLYADRIKAIHVKDFLFDGKICEVKLGNGNFDYQTFLSLLNEYDVKANLLLEGYPPADYENARNLLTR